LIKTIFDKKTGEILGVHMIGAEVTEMIGAYLVAKTGELTDLDIAKTIFPHPTLSEMLHESALQSLGIAIHI
jgi:dihydrolipoamide dehydrogenase